MGVKDSSSVNTIPSKLLTRDFHKEIRLIVQYLRENRRKRPDKGAVFRPNKGAVFFGPSGTGKSWASQAVLVDELKDAEVSGKAVVYFDSVANKAFVFGKERNVLIESLTSPNVGDIPELMVRDTVLIYDAMRGAQGSLTCFPCEYIIFSSPNVGNLKNVAGNHGLVRFVCPNWTLEELQLLEHGSGDRFPPEEVESVFERFGGSPRAVVANDTSISETRQENDVRLLLKGVHLWSDRIALSAD